ncbi:MAG: D-sedoheptulose 7-phosphate isomerase [Alphaproteobacteria bacterium]
MTFDLDTYWSTEHDEHLTVAEKAFQTLKPDFERMLDVCATAVSNGGKILFFGNGGSAADAQHLATELTIRYISDRKPIPAIALTTDTSALTAAGNDYGFDHIFSRQLEALGNAGDIAIGISTSGNSQNVLNALKSATNKNMTTIGLTGNNGGKMNDLCDITLTAPSTTTARIQEIHILIGHLLCGALEQKLGLV